MSNYDFSKRKVFITGASRGIGAAIKKAFADSGAEVIAPPHSELDLSDNKSIEQYLSRNDLEDVDIFVHCAGINKLAGIDEISDELLSEVFQVNYYSAVKLLNAFVPNMKARKYGRIVFITSLYGIVSRERRIAYSSSKHAINGLMKTMALELAPYGILVDAVAPGYVMTDMTKKNLTDEEIKSIQKNIPTGCFQQPEEIAETVLFLCSDGNKSITGQSIAVDGGFLCR